MELKDFKLPEGIEVDFKPEVISESEVDFSDYFKNKSAEELEGIVSGSKQRNLEEDYSLTAEYDDEEYEKSNSLLNRFLSKMKKIIGVL